MFIDLVEYSGSWKSSFQWNLFAKSSLCLRIQTQGTNIFWGITSSYTFSSISYLSLFLSKIHKNNFHKSNNSFQSVSKFQLVKASSKLIQQLFYLTTGLLMELIWTGIPNTAVTMEIFHCTVYPILCKNIPEGIICLSQSRDVI